MPDEIRGVVVHLPFLSITIHGTPDELRGIKVYLVNGFIGFGFLALTLYMLWGFTLVLNALIPHADAVIFIIIAMMSALIVWSGTSSSRATARGILPATPKVEKPKVAATP